MSLLNTTAEGSTSTAEQPPSPTQAAPPQRGPQRERPTNCAQCNKRLRKRAVYYRNNAYYCNKRCFKEQRTAAPRA